MTQARSIPAAVQTGLEQSDQPDALMGFLTVTHPSLTETIHIVSDLMDYVKGGVLFQGIVFGFKMLTDSDGIPYSELRVSNIDRRIGRALRDSTDRAQVQLEIATSADFDLTVDPRTEIGTAAIIYSFTKYELVDVGDDVTELQGRVMIRDYAQEPWPRISTTQSKLPALFR